MAACVLGDGRDAVVRAAARWVGLPVAAAPPAWASAAALRQRQREAPLVRAWAAGREMEEKRDSKKKEEAKHEENKEAVGGAEVAARLADGRQLASWGEVFHWGRKVPLRRQPAPRAARPAPRCRLLVDVASPWARLAYARRGELERECGAAVEVVPVLVGALFRAAGTADVPLLRYEPQQRARALQSLQRWADEAGVAVRWPSQFPIRSVTALRVFEASGRNAEVGRVLFDACWAHDRNVSDEEGVRAALREAGLDAEALLAGARDPAVKQRLRDQTESAAKRGVCGVPTFEYEEFSIWGQDKMDLLKDLLNGWRPGMPSARL